MKWEDIGRMYGENPFPAAKVNIYHKNSQSRDRTEERIRIVGLKVAMARAETTSLELSAPGCDKGVGLEMLCACLKLPMEQTFVVADCDHDKGVEAVESYLLKP